jgi:hypothetical protein
MRRVEISGSDPYGNTDEVPERDRVEGSVWLTGFDGVDSKGYKACGCEGGWKNEVVVKCVARDGIQSDEKTKWCGFLKLASRIILGVMFWCDWKGIRKLLSILLRHESWLREIHRSRRERPRIIMGWGRGNS